jgi:hypothetical protein
MTNQQLLIMTVLYLIMGGVFVYFTRPTRRRFLGAFAGGAAMGVAVLFVVPVGEAVGLWRTSSWTSLSWPLLVLALLVSGPILPLLSWRVARRFGGRGLAVLTAVLAIIGPPRDYAISAQFPEWITFGPGIGPVLAVSAIYAGAVIVAHGVMRLIAGPSDADALAARLREGTPPRDEIDSTPLTADPRGER